MKEQRVKRSLEPIDQAMIDQTMSKLGRFWLTVQIPLCDKEEHRSSIERAASTKLLGTGSWIGSGYYDFDFGYRTKVKAMAGAKRVHRLAVPGLVATVWDKTLWLPNSVASDASTSGDTCSLSFYASTVFAALT